MVGLGWIDPGVYALLTRLHGVLGWLGLAALAHPVLTLRPRLRPSARQRLSAALAVALVSAPAAIGWAIYPSYRAQVKPGLVVDALPWAMAFETKEHLATMTVALAWGGGVALWQAGDKRPGRAAARALFGAALLCGVAVGLIGLVVGAAAHPGW